MSDVSIRPMWINGTAVKPMVDVLAPMAAKTNSEVVGDFKIRTRYNRNGELVLEDATPKRSITTRAVAFSNSIDGIGLISGVWEVFDGIVKCANGNKSAGIASVLSGLSLLAMAAKSSVIDLMKHIRTDAVSAGKNDDVPGNEGESSSSNGVKHPQTEEKQRTRRK
ncbi:MAG: hypothetical protein LBB18_00290 [Puniceicoccales bacterium]|nr:hypothetical protein [Puniceicoccales bacterium]